MSLSSSRESSSGGGEQLARGEVRTVCVVVWREAVTAARFRLQREALERSVRRHGSKTAFLCVVEPRTVPPDDTLRKASIEMVTSNASSLACVACVIEGNGFGAAAVRSVFSAMHLVVSTLSSGRRFPPIAFFATVSEAVSWMSQYVDIGQFEVFCAEVQKIREEPTVRSQT